MTLLLFVFAFFCSCTVSTKNELTSINPVSSNGVGDSSYQVVRTFSLSWNNFLSNSDKSFDSALLQTLAPTHFMLQNDKILIPNKYLERIDIYEKNGRLNGSIKYKGHNIDVVKFYINDDMDSLYLLDPYKGLFILSSSGVILYQDEKTIDFVVADNGNVFFKNSFEGQRAYLDKDGILKRPIIGDYATEFIDNGLLVGLKIFGTTFDSPFALEKINLRSGSRIYQSTQDSICVGCLKFPKLISSDLMIISNDASGKDEVLLFSQNGKIENVKPLNLPSGMHFFSNAEYVDYSYSGLSYFYESRTKKLSIMGSDISGIKIFECYLN